MNSHIIISQDLHSKIEIESQSLGISVEEFVRITLEQAISESRTNDPLFADDAVFRGHVPADISANHDDYLYGDET